ncbi:secreted RxLR effector protein 161-like [Rutidosis leptorrhynchoides]|uniref:secreted RxLR effector protein 161-like n=1 Tax=Rutidosis leptorrhynchoides TaxID=125765 RepID=UPI003A9A49DC
MEEENEEIEKVPYASAVGSVMYAMVKKSPDIAHSVGVVSRYMSIWGNGIGKRGYTDANLSECDDSVKSTTGYVFTIEKTTVSWMSRLQRNVASSNTEHIKDGTLVLKKVLGSKNPRGYAY